MVEHFKRLFLPSIIFVAVFRLQISIFDFKLFQGDLTLYVILKAIGISLFVVLILGFLIAFIFALLLNLLNWMPFSRGFRPPKGLLISAILCSASLPLFFVMPQVLGITNEVDNRAAGFGLAMLAVSLATFVAWVLVLVMGIVKREKSTLQPIEHTPPGVMHSPVIISGFALFLCIGIGVSVWSSTSTESGSLFIGLQFPEGSSSDRRNVVIVQLKAEMLEHFEELESIEVFVARIDVDHPLASSIFGRQILFVINPGDRWRRGKAKQLLANSLRVYANKVFVGIEVFVMTDRPSVQIRESYTSTEANFVPHQAKLELLGITETALSAALATRLRLSSGSDSSHTLQEISLLVEGQFIKIKQVGAFEVVRTEVRGADLPAPHWVPFSQDTDVRLSGVTITLDEYKLAALGLDLGEVETTIIHHLSAVESTLDVKLFSQLPIEETQDGSRIRLLDIARIEQSWITNPQGEVNGVPYKIQLNE